MAKVSYYDNSTNTWIDIPGVQGATGNFVGDASTITTNQVAIANGGTAATSASTARTSLGAAISPIWYAPTVASSINGGSNLVANTAYDAFGLINGVTVATSTTYLVDLVISGTITNVTTATVSTIRAAFDGDAVSSVNMAIHMAHYPNVTPSANSGANSVITSTGSTLVLITNAVTAGTSIPFMYRASGILRTKSTGQYFQPKIGVSNTSSSGTTIAINKDSYATLTALGTSTTTTGKPSDVTVGTWS